MIFTDLDGTLLDHYSYSSEPALPAIARLQSANVPIIPTTSKTYAEVSQIVKSLGLNSPIIIENGAAIYLPIQVAKCLELSEIDEQQAFYKVSFTKTHDHWVSLLAKMEAEFGELYTSFTDLGVNGIVEYTGLSPENAKLAANREYGEPVVWHGNEQQKQAFVAALTNLGASPVEGGRFIHICGNCSKGMALTWLASKYQQYILDQAPITIALGDGKNDIAMLEVASIAVKVRSPSHQPPALARTDKVITTQGFGPEGWAEAINQIFSLN